MQKWRVGFWLGPVKFYLEMHGEGYEVQIAAAELAPKLGALFDYDVEEIF